MCVYPISMCVCPICVSVPYVSLSHMCVFPTCVSVPHVRLSFMWVCPNAFLWILQLLYLPPPKGEQKAAGGGLFASTWKEYLKKILVKNLYNKERFLSVCPDTRHAYISQPISKLSTSTDSPGTRAVDKNTLEAIGAQTKKF